MHIERLRSRLTPGAMVEHDEAGVTRLSIPAGGAGVYRLSQLDDTSGAVRADFVHPVGLRLSLAAKASVQDLPGTWGFGLWNDPFSISLGVGGGSRRFPALPQAAWYFHGSPPNHLTFRDDLPGKGFFAGVFQSQRLPGWLLASAALGFPLMGLRPLARTARRMARTWITEDARLLSTSVSKWHDYELVWEPTRTRFKVDGETILTTSLSPRGPLGLVIWIDNQYAALPPDGKLAFGTLANPDAWLAICDLQLERLS